VPGESYCFGAENEWSNIDLIGLLCDTLERIRKPQSGKPYSALISFISDRLGHDFRYSIDPTKAHDELGFIVTRNFEDSIEETIRWYLENEDWRRKVTGNSR
jgi:dTDP-glucose 4,6-dehydratase